LLSEHTIAVSALPSAVNSQLTLASLKNGSILMARMTAVEDKGFVWDLGLKGALP